MTRDHFGLTVRHCKHDIADLLMEQLRFTMFVTSFHTVGFLSSYAT